MSVLIPEALTDLNRLKTLLSPQANFPTVDATMFSQLINSASQFIMTFCNRNSFKYRTVSDERHDGKRSPHILTDSFPLISITSLYDDPSRDFTGGTLLESNTYEIQDSASGIVRLLDSRFYDGKSNVKIAYVSGYSEFEIITSHNNSIVVNEGGSDISVSISAGNYTSFSLATELQSQLTSNNSTTGTYTVTYSETMRRFIIATTASELTIKWTTSSNLGELLGFDTTSDSSGAVSYVADYSELGVPEDLIEATNSLVRWRYEEVRERRIGRTSLSTDTQSTSFDFSNIPNYIIQMFAPYQIRRI